MFNFNPLFVIATSKVWEKMIKGNYEQKAKDIREIRREGFGDSMELRKNAEEILGAKIANEHAFPWGRTIWLEPGEAQNCNSTVSVAMYYPGQTQPSHPHVGYEEVMLGLQGETTHICDGKEFVLKKGELGHIPNAADHTITNRTETTAVFLSVINAVPPKSLPEMANMEDIDLRSIADLVNLDAIVVKFSNNVNLPVVLIDASGNILKESSTFPEFCLLCCKHQFGDCPLCIGSHRKKVENQKIFHCKFGLYSIYSPIIDNDRVLGYLACGYGKMAVPEEQGASLVTQSIPERDQTFAVKTYEQVDILNRNHLKSVSETLSLFSTTLVQMLIQSFRGKQINEYKLSLAREKQRQAELQNSLNEARLKFLESQVNPHFLFNTLNTIAQASLMEGADTASDLTFALSNMLRRSLGKAETLITIEEELTHINDYLLIQQTRFPEKFTTEIEVSDEVKQVKIPFMTLMILVENAIVHGFKDIFMQGKLFIRGDIQKDYVVLEVIDNGCGVDASLADFIKTLANDFSLPAMKGIGLKNIFKRLEYYYGPSFELELVPLPERGTKAVIKLPWSESK